MVLYYCGATREAEDVKSPNVMLNFHCMMKYGQAGMVLGAAAGGLIGLMRKNFRVGTVFTDMTNAIGACGVAGFAAGLPAAQYHYAGLSFEEKQKEAFKVQKSLWHNRLDLLTLAGLAGGAPIAATSVYTGFLAFIGAETLPLYGCFVWTTFGGFLLDVPLVIAGVLYYAHVDDIDVVGCKKEDD